MIFKLNTFQLVFGLLLIALMKLPVGVHAQSVANTAAVGVQNKVPLNGLFDTDTILEITLKGSIKELLNDRTDAPSAHSIILAYKAGDGTEVSIPLVGKTRGHFRKLQENCTYPPISLQFNKGEVYAASIFNHQDKMKLVMPCMGDQYVVREWLVYKLYNLVTPESFRARLIKVNLAINKDKKPAAPFYGILLEEEKQMANRNGMMPVTRMLKSAQTFPESYLKMAVFEYLIGNTDWSIEYQQNIKLIAADSLAVPTAVPYDFDHAGIVNAPYAKPAEDLLMYGVRERRYRGYCVKNMKDFDETIAFYNQIKNEVYGLYANCALLDEKYKKATLKYLDDFYATINNAKAVQKEFGYPCDENGTGNVIIKGLKKN
jgi:hypothetical protein